MHAPIYSFVYGWIQDEMDRIFRQWNVTDLSFVKFDGRSSNQHTILIINNNQSITYRICTEPSIYSARYSPVTSSSCSHILFIFFICFYSDKLQTKPMESPYFHSNYLFSSHQNQIKFQTICTHFVLHFRIKYVFFFQNPFFISRFEH